MEKFEMQQKATVWFSFEVEAETLDEAKQKAMKGEGDNYWVIDDTQDFLPIYCLTDDITDEFGEGVQTVSPTCGHVVSVCPNGEGDPFACQSFCELCEGIGDYCPTCSAKPLARVCTCEKPDAPGWHVVDDAGISFGGLKQAQNESASDMARWIANIYFTKGEKLFANLMHDIADGVIEQDAYAASCEWLANEG